MELKMFEQVERAEQAEQAKQAEQVEILKRDDEYTDFAPIFWIFMQKEDLETQKCYEFRSGTNERSTRFQKRSIL